MSYLVLARKWRPKRFAELVGQQHVVQALTNALESGRVHHAFLFSGTRGVGKTTIARIFAKSLNCESGSSAEPCGTCDTCLAIDAGRYVDLLEIDAASHTGIDDVRELIDNAQYMPSRGRVKVYLIDEVHMLSKPAFNALLKTLEEPPGHVKFLLATTDPQKLPVTVLSRCLQFNLKRLDEQQIEGQISRILEAEGIGADAGAIVQLSRAADGSLRDGLSLLDQAIAYTGAAAGGAGIGDAAVATMLGSVDRTRVGAMLGVLASGGGQALMAEVTALAELSPDWGGVLDALADALHRIQVRQLVPGIDVAADGIDVAALAATLRPEIVQLWYQMALHGRRDLALAPSARTGFEMTVLRMLAFRPADDGVTESKGAPAGQGASPRSQSSTAGPAPVPAPARGDGNAAAAAPAAFPVPATAAPTVAVLHAPPIAAPPAPAPVVVAASIATPPPDAVEVAISLRLDADQWHDLVTGSGLRGPTRELAAHAVFVGFVDGVLTLALPPADDHLRAPSLVALLARGLADRLGGEPQIRFQVEAPVAGETLHQRSARSRDARQAQVETRFMADPGVQQLMQRQGATLVPDSIRPYDD